MTTIKYEQDKSKIILERGELQFGTWSAAKLKNGGRRRNMQDLEDSESNEWSELEVLNTC